MSKTKMLITIVYIIVALVLLVLCTIQANPNEQPTDSMVENANDSFYSKNKKNTEEGKREIAIRILSAVFVVLIIASYFVK